MHRFIMYQKVLITQDVAYCKKCNANILDISNFKYAGECFNDPIYREELCECRKCGTKFVIRYNLFDADGHIDPRVFSGDINDNNYNWQENLSEEQKQEIGAHLKSCKLCNERLSEEMLADAWFASIIHRHKDPS